MQKRFSGEVGGREGRWRPLDPLVRASRAKCVSVPMAPPGPRRPGRWAILRSKFCDECGAEPPSRAPRTPRPLPRQPRPRSGAAPTAQEEEVGSSRSLAVAATPEAATMGKQKSGTYIRPCQCLPQKHMRAPFCLAPPEEGRKLANPCLPILEEMKPFLESPR